MRLFLRQVLRLIAWIFILSAAVGVAYDVTGSFAGHGSLVATSLGEFWNNAHRASLEHVRELVSHYIPWAAEAHYLNQMLQLPAWLVAVVLGGLLYVLSLRRANRVVPAAISEAGPNFRAAGSPTGPGSEIRAALASCRGAFIGIGLFSALINILALTGALFMLEIYDRVLPSRSIPTLVGLSILAVLLFSSQGLLDLLRGRVLVRIGASLDRALSRRIYGAIVRLPLKSAGRSDGLQPLRDLDTIRSFLSGLGPTALFDLPWMPIYLGIIFAFHPLLGTVAVAGALFLVVLTLLTEVLTKSPTKVATNFLMARQGLAETSRRNAEVLVAMGMAGRMGDHWGEANDGYLAGQQRANDVSGGFGAVSRIVRVMLQSAVLGIGAYLVIHQEATAGIIIAGAILTARAFAPVDLAISNWKGFVAARQSRQRLSKLLDLLPEAAASFQLPPPHMQLSVESVSAAPPGGQKIVVQDVSFALTSGQGLGVIGPSAAGKSSLARMLVGVWVPARGKVRLDGAALDQWAPDALGPHIGYLPQDVELFPGTVSQNIARFDPAPDAAVVIAAAEVAGAHDLIVNLAEGYETKIGEQGTGLSAGQQQRIALARALYGDPFLVVLDEPNSNLDAEGEAALTQAILRVRGRGGIVVVIAHRPSALEAVDTVLAMAQGRALAFGPRDEVLSKVLRPTAPAAGPLRVVPHPEGAHA